MSLAACCPPPSADPAADPAAEELRWYAELRRDDSPPTDEDLYGLLPDPGTDPLSPAAPWPAATGPATPLPETLRAGTAATASPDGAGFCAGGPADRLAPGMVLAGLAAREWAAGLARVSDDALVGLMAAWRRLASWATAGEAAAVAELSSRRLAQVAAGADPQLAEHAGDEIAPPLTLTRRAADRLLSFASRLGELPLTGAALAAGEIDSARARVIVDELTGLDPAHAAAVEAAVIGRAPGQTTGQLRAATRRAVLAADPAAARVRRKQAEKEARVEVWNEPAGTAALAGRDLPPAEVLAADRHISGIACRLREAGAAGTLDQLRACVYTRLLAGHSPGAIVAHLTPPVTSPEDPGQEPAGPATADGDVPVPPPSGALPPTGAPPPAPATGPAPLARPEPLTGPAPLTGTVNLTVPLGTVLGGASEPGEVAGFGPVSADDARALIRQLAATEATRWCITLTSREGHALAHGCARLTAEAVPRAPGQASGWELAFTIRPLADRDCAHRREGKGYRPSPSLRHLICIRQDSCSFPGCRRPAARCDLDHTIPYDQGGRTCECNLAPLCRAHHQAKQAAGWHLEQPRPGVLVWTLPHGRKYRARRSAYPPDDPGASAHPPDERGTGARQPDDPGAGAHPPDDPAA